MVTGEQILKLIASEIEDQTIAFQVRDYFNSRAGKSFTKRDIDRINTEIAGHWTIRKSASMTYVQTDEYWKSGGKAGYSFLISYAEKNIVCPDAATLQQYNSAHFAGATGRNAQRADALKDLATADRIAKLAHTILESQRELDGIFQFRQPFDADRYAIQKLVGLSK